MKYAALLHARMQTCMITHISNTENILFKESKLHMWNTQNTQSRLKSGNEKRWKCGNVEKWGWGGNRKGSDREREYMPGVNEQVIRETIKKAREKEYKACC